MSPESISSRREAEDVLITKAQEDEAFRQELLTNPAAAIRRVLGVDLPPGLTITVVEETRDNLYLVLPPKSTGELADRELTEVAGGGLADASRSDSSWGKLGDLLGPNPSAPNPGSTPKLF